MSTDTKKRGKRIKKVFSGIQGFVHLWAHQSQDEARSRNAYFEGEVIYSYGRHFPIARIYTDPKGKKTVFFTTRTYSSTTSGHVSSVRSACSHMDILYMENVITADTEYINSKGMWEYEHKKNIGTMVSHASDVMLKFSRARNNKSYLLREARTEVANLKKYLDFFKLHTKAGKKVKNFMDDINSTKYDEQVREATRKADEQLQWEIDHPTEAAEKKRKAREARDRKETEAAAEQIEKWRNFEAYRPYPTKSSRHSFGYHLPDLLRYDESEERIETSQGVKVPAEAARRFYRHIKAVLHNGGCVTEESCMYKVLDYQVREITTEHIRIGCHRILMSEVEAMVKQLNWK